MQERFLTDPESVFTFNDFLSCGRCPLFAITISVLALLLTLYQLYLQRVHNAKSLKPLGQIDFRDRNRQLAVWIANNGMGPMIIDRITFFKDSNFSTNIEECLSLNARSYRRIQINDTVKKVVLPNASFEVFATEFEEHEGEAEITNARKQLSAIMLKVHYRDIYDHKFTLKRNLDWFSRHITDENTKSGSTSKVSEYQ